MSTLATADLTAGTPLAAGENWIELVPAVHAEPHQVSFPAVIEPRRHHGLWVRPRLRREVADAVCEWLNVVYPIDPDWYPLARFEDDQLVVFTGDAARHRHEIGPDVGGRYPLGELGRWFLSAPTRARRHRTVAARNRRLQSPGEGETLVSYGPGTHARSVFPARVESCAAAGGRVVVFRPEIAQAVAEYCTSANQEFPDDYPLVYFEGGTLVHVHQHHRARDGYLPWRIDPGPDGAYRVDRDEWPFDLLPGKSEGIVHAFRAIRPTGEKRP
ncbi:hypothetical protein [Amycolatopsis sp. NPDC051061]|uniref:hypothetical protein n=1 Tax=Amycolatopsis sp. NPDC051061 TaxID=3155042 RepID=UPI00344766C5